MVEENFVRVAVLMSTYNGELFIGDQVRSILMQLPENGRLLVRDDGSDDSTVSQIEAFGDSRISVLRGKISDLRGAFFGFS